MLYDPSTIGTMSAMGAIGLAYISAIKGYKKNGIIKSELDDIYQEIQQAPKETLEDLLAIHELIQTPRVGRAMSSLFIYSTDVEFKQIVRIYQSIHKQLIDALPKTEEGFEILVTLDYPSYLYLPVEKNNQDTGKDADDTSLFGLKYVKYQRYNYQKEVDYIKNTLTTLILDLMDKVETISQKELIDQSSKFYTYISEARTLFPVSSIDVILLNTMVASVLHMRGIDSEIVKETKRRIVIDYYDLKTGKKLKLSDD